MKDTSSAEIHATLERILSSPAFRTSARMCRFLRFVVECSVRQDFSQLKESTIGIHVFDRDPAYDPKSDPIVRVEARRLRTKLEHYYQSVGPEERLLIAIPKGGYVPNFSPLEPPPEMIPTEAQSSSKRALPPPVVPRRSQRWLAWTASLAVALAAVASFAWLRHSHHGEPLPVTALPPITSYVGFELDPAVSPDGKQVAFVWDGNQNNFDIYVKLTEVGSPVRLTTDPAHDLHPAWSPDGQYLAFLRVSPDRQDVMLIPALGGPERRVATIRSEVAAWRADATQMYGFPGPTWAPDGKFLAVADRSNSGSGYGLFLIPTGSGASRQLTFPTGGANDFYPTFSPDGRNLAFSRSTSNSSCDIFVVPAAGGTPRQITHDRRDIRGLSWMSDSRGLVISSNRSGPYALWALDLDGDLRLIPTNAQYASGPSVARDGWIAYTNRLQNTNIWSLNAGVKAPTMLIASSLRNNSARLSPDGRRLVFVSDRSGSWELWSANRDGSNPIAMTHFGGPMVGAPNWSPDAKWIAFDARPEDHAAIFVIPADGGPPRRLSRSKFEERMPSWSADGQWIYFNSNRDGSVKLWKAHPDGSNPVRLTSRLAYDSAEAGRFVYFCSIGPGIWRVSRDGGDESLVPGLESPYPRRYWAVTPKGLYFLNHETAPRQIGFYNFATSTITHAAQIDAELVIDTPSLAASPDGKTILYAQQDVGGSDINRISIAQH